MVVAVLATACTEKLRLEPGLGGFDVTITVSGSGGDGSAASPFDIPGGEVTVHYSATAYDVHGQPLDFTGPVGVQAAPGQIVSVNPDPPRFSEGRAEGEVSVRKVFGRFTLWLQDVQLVPGDVVEGGSKPLQLLRREGSFAAGTSNAVFFRRPRLYEIQYAPWLEQEENIDSSVLHDMFVDIDCRADDPAGPFQDGHGQLVVTGIFNEGFFVSDLAGDGAFNHLYVYNYSYPDDVEVGDRLDRLVGSSQDFSGCTQISFPSWQRAVDERLDPEPFRIDDLDGALPPALITTAMCNENSTSNLHLCGHSKKNWTMEARESSRVRLENVRAPDVFVDCDFNGDSEVVPDWLDASHPEAVCMVNCLKHDGAVSFAVQTVVGTGAALADVIEQDPVMCPWEADLQGVGPRCRRVRIGGGHICAELTTMRQFGQWVVALDDGTGPLINVITSQSLVNYDPLAAENLGRTIPFLQGNLLQVRAARPRWVVYVGRLAGDAPADMQR
ncbi:MAG: hypothetical protein DRI34_08045 [Deltaproteobacteria bacterium]|nr:MAG: hypothetical protein DRI34_08045 [Deltaproteobacteria bacterium]